MNVFCWQYTSFTSNNTARTPPTGTNVGFKNIISRDCTHTLHMHVCKNHDRKGRNKASLLTIIDPLIPLSLSNYNYIYIYMCLINYLVIFIPKQIISDCFCYI
ncbi:hypothetical protein DAI22_05g041150 [Oryza sativa Japonica Group]|nr:hypothetical protein DAI22_05g041150 [Oryza sativa Japonica Group]